MKKPSVTYRFFCTLTACVVLLSASIPVGAHAGGIADFCDIDMSEHHALPMSEAESCDMPEHRGAGHDHSTSTSDSTEDCPLDLTCTCILDSTNTRANAIPALSKVFAGYTPAVVDILDDQADQKHIHPSEQVFATLYSPPIFLKNSSFLN